MGKYFTIAELCDSVTAKSKGISNVPTSMEEQSLKRLIEKVIDPLREAYGRPISVNSGYRSPQLNRVVNGATNSQHVLGEAVDITGGNAMENKKLFDLAIKLKLPFDQLIDEKNYRWIHVSYGARNRRQILHLK